MSARPLLSQSPPTSAPLRRCVVCRESAPKPQLLRLVRRPDGEIRIDASAEGRGAYVHPQPQCLTAAASRPKHLAYALRRPPPAAVLTQLTSTAQRASDPRHPENHSA